MTTHRLPTAPSDLLASAVAGNRLALARLLTMVERGEEAGRVVARLSLPGAVPYTVGITGAPGAGKSTLTDRLLEVARTGWPGEGPVEKVAVLAIDPTSPFTGGAILGDRVRMQRHATDPSIFIRSFATRGHMGGLAAAVPDAVRLLGAVGYPLVLVETVGVGQVEIDVASTTDTTVVVLTPRWGDSMQANKAGLLEVADVFTINKADQPGVAETRRDLELMLDLFGERPWRPEITETSATEGRGVQALWDAIGAHRAHLRRSGELTARRADRAERELERAVAARIAARVQPLLAGAAGAQARAELAAGRAHPAELADHLIDLAAGNKPAREPINEPATEAALPEGSVRG